MYNFDEIIDRRNANAMNPDSFRIDIFHADNSLTFPYKELIRMCVADTKFATVEEGLRRICQAVSTKHTASSSAT